MLSPLPAISLVLPLFSDSSRKSSTSKKSNFKHYDTGRWEPVTDKGNFEHICMSPDHCPFNAQSDDTGKSENKHVCVSRYGCLYNH